MFPIKKEKNKVVIMILVILVLGLVIGFVYKNTNDIIATVDGEKIRKNDLYELLVNQYGQQGLDMLVTQKIIELESIKENVTVNDEDIEKELKKTQDYYGGEEAFSQALEAAGISIDYIKKDFEINLKLKKLLEKIIIITEEGMKTFFTENKDLFNVEEQVEASHILVNTEEEAMEIKTKLDEGSDFSELAKEYSIDYTNKDSGGNLGTFKRGEMVEEFENVAFSLDIGEISNPVETDYGYHIIKVTDKIAAKEAIYDENKEEIKDMILEEKMQTEYYTWLDEKYAEYDIEKK